MKCIPKIFDGDVKEQSSFDRTNGEMPGYVDGFYLKPCDVMGFGIGIGV